MRLSGGCCLLLLRVDAAAVAAAAALLAAACSSSSSVLLSLFASRTALGRLVRRPRGRSCSGSPAAAPVTPAAAAI